MGPCAVTSQMIEHPIPEALTFDDVLLVPAFSEVVPNQVSTETRLTRRIRLNTPLLSAAMDTVTESRLAIAMAQQGGIGIIHRNLSIEQQATEVDKVKRSESGMIVDPVTIGPESLISDALDVMRRYKISGVPVTQGKRLVGILTNRDLRFETRTDIPVSDVMTKKDLITVPVGTTLEDAEAILHDHRVEKLLVVNGDYELKGLITVKDIQKKLKYPNASKDEQGRLRVGAAIGATGDYLERAAELIRNRCDALSIDSAHGHSSRVLEAVREIKKRFPETDLLAGNVATYEGTLALIDAGADAVKVGIGPGSICTTRMVTGAGMPQITAISEAYKAGRERDVPVIADGGIKYSCDLTKSTRARVRRVCTRGGASRRIAGWVRCRRWRRVRGSGTSRARAISSSRQGGRKAWWNWSAQGRTVWRSLCRKVSKAGCRIAGRWRRWCTSWSAGCGPAWATWAARRLRSSSRMDGLCGSPAPGYGKATSTT
jgi:IMP dehydrogenase